MPEICAIQYNDMHHICSHQDKPQAGALQHLLGLQASLTRQLVLNQKTCWREDSLKNLTVQNKKLSRQLRHNYALLQHLCGPGMPDGQAIAQGPMKWPRSGAAPKAF